MNDKCGSVKEQHWDTEEEPGTALAQSKQAARGARSSVSSPAAEAVWQQKAEKWKARCHELRQEISALSVEAAARDAALQVRLTSSCNLKLKEALCAFMDTPVVCQLCARLGSIICMAVAA